MKEVDLSKNLLIEVSGDFSTNTYGQYSNYLELVNHREEKSEEWGSSRDSQPKGIIDQMKLDMTGKQMMNKTRMTAVDLKKKAVDYMDSLI